MRFELIAVNLDQKQPGFPEEVLPEYLSALDIEYHIIEKDPTVLLRKKYRKGRPPADFVPAYVAEFSIILQKNTALPRLLWGTIGMTCWKRCS